eukprot:TRINITY_DN48192_c0_g1_i1.p1 TRINITY_DN48192_c0_g1~~TRINITY_DN48192_c0_g1_i1.p1  ORF type:complete len:323 (-),score=49.98 TRINITY_DN48192_c0_g1_i1:105-974(-)
MTFQPTASSRTNDSRASAFSHESSSQAESEADSSSIQEDGEQKEVMLSLRDGTTIAIPLLSEVEAVTWAWVTRHLTEHPEIAKSFDGSIHNPELLRDWIWDQLDVIVNQFRDVPELDGVFSELEMRDMSSVIEYWEDDDVVLRFAAKMDGIPEDVGKKGTAVEFFDAVKNGDLEVIAEYLSRGPPVNTQDDMGFTPLAYALGKKRTDIAKALLRSRSNPASVDARGNSALHYAAGYRLLEMFDILVTAKFDLEAENNDGETPLMIAKKNMYTDCVRSLSELQDHFACRH